jgi:hypothetical protein
LGIEPTASTAQAARAKGIDIVEAFFGVALAQKLVAQNQQADLMAANNVLAHVPDINDFVQGFALLLKHDGVATFEFPHLYSLIKDAQFDTIYHEHFSYLSLIAVEQIFSANGLEIFRVDHLRTHGGSLRVFAQRKDTGQRPIEASVENVLALEQAAKMSSLEGYAQFQARTDQIKNDLLDFLIHAKREGKTVAAYGAAAKGNTLMNYAGIRSDLIQYVVDRNPAKQNKYMPGNRLPIVQEDHLKNTKPDYVVLFPWNLKSELISQLVYIREWGGQFVIAIPHLQVL